MNKLMVGLLMGGTSSERGVSLATGKELFANINRDRFDVACVEWNADNSWTEYYLNSLSAVKTVHKNALELFRGLKPDIVFIALHGANGEDGRLQGFLDILGIPYTGSGVLGSALGMNKLLCKQIFRASDVATPEHLVCGGQNPAVAEEVDLKIRKTIGYPCVVKPNASGSSIGVTKVHNAMELPEALARALKEDEYILIEKYIKGIEVSVAVMGEHDSSEKLVLPIVEIVPANEFFDYESKYTDGKSRELVPARISKEMEKRLGEQAVRVHDALMCNGYSRIDFLIKDDVLYALEINTLPGMTNNSLYPKMARAVGMTFPQLIDKLIDLGLARFPKKTLA